MQKTKKRKAEKKMRNSLISFLIVVISCLLVTSCNDGLKLTTNRELDDHIHLGNYDVIINTYPASDYGTIYHIFHKDIRDRNAQVLYINGEKADLELIFSNHTDSFSKTQPRDPYWRFEYPFEPGEMYKLKFIGNRKGREYMVDIRMVSVTKLTNIYAHIDGSYTVNWDLEKNSNI